MKFSELLKKVEAILNPPDAFTVHKELLDTYMNMALDNRDRQNAGRLIPFINKPESKQ